MTFPSPIAADADAAILTTVAIADIVVRDRLRRVLPDRVEALGESMRKVGQMVPIDLVDIDGGLRLVFGAHRLAARLAMGETSIRALVHPRDTFGNEAAIRRREIAENFDRFELTMLEKAANVAAMRELHDEEFGRAKPGPKPKSLSNEQLDEMSANLALNFPDVVQRTLGLSRREVFRHLKVATIDAGLRDQLAAHPLADNQSELLSLAAETPARQRQVVGLLLDEADAPGSVAEALARIDGTPAARPLQPHERVAGAFARLKPQQQDQFFDLHADAIGRWQLSRRGARR